MHPGDRIVSCQGKVAIDSLSLAQTIAARMRRKHDDRLRGYHCKHCGKFHVGAPHRESRRGN